MKPSLVSNKWFRSCIRKLLIELPNEVPGLGLIVTGKENVMMVYPRYSTRIETRVDLLALNWFTVEFNSYAIEPEFKRMNHKDINTFLELLCKST